MSDLATHAAPKASFTPVQLFIALLVGAITFPILGAFIFWSINGMLAVQKPFGHPQSWLTAALVVYAAVTAVIYAVGLNRRRYRLVGIACLAAPVALLALLLVFILDGAF